nr:MULTISPECIES: hypothetical protein [unclassified Pseudomonas]
MREIAGIEEVVQRLLPHWDAIEAHFHQENERFVALFAHDHDLLGRILKCHLIVEHYLDRYLSEKLGLQHLEDARLTFAQKARLLPTAGSAASFVKPGILRLNAIRNRFGHNLRADVHPGELGAINEVLEVARRGVEFPGAVERIEAFTTVACTWLVVPPAHLEQVFADAFAQVEVDERPL